MKFVCENPDCERFGVVDEEFNNTYKMVDGHLLSDKAPCPVCGKIYNKAISEIKRNELKGRLNFCSISCAATYRNLHPCKSVLEAQQKFNSIKEYFQSIQHQQFVCLE